MIWVIREQMIISLWAQKKALRRINSMILRIFLFNQMEFGLGREANADFNKASDFLYITNKASFKNSSSLENIVFFRQASKDYWITRGNPKYWYVKKPKNYGTEIKFSDLPVISSIII